MSDKHLENITRLAQQLIQLQAEAQAYGDGWLQQAETDAAQRKASGNAAYHQALFQAQSAYQEAVAQAQDIHDRTVSVTNRQRDAEMRMSDKHLQNITYLAQQLLQIDVEAQMCRHTWVKQVEAETEQRKAGAEATYRQAATQAQSTYQQVVTQAQATHDQTVAAANHKRDMALAAALAAYESQSASTQAASASIWDDAGLLGAEWNSFAWHAWQPGNFVSAAGLPLVQIGVRIGTLTETGSWDVLTFPASLSLIGYRSLLMKSFIEARSTAVDAMQSLLLRLLGGTPPGKLRFIFLDPVGLGQNVAPFMHLADYDDALIASRAWTEPHHIEQRLAELTEHIETVIQKYLRNNYTDIEAYNAEAGEVAEPYRVLVVHDFPVNFSEAAARRLVSIVQNGPRCGVYTIILADMSKPLPHGFSLADLEQNTTIIAWNGERFVWQDADFKDCRLKLDVLPPARLTDRNIKAVGAAAKVASKVEVPYSRIALPADERWTASAADDLVAALGPSGATRVQFLTLGRGTAIHALVAGRTGSGKSSLLHTLITSLALKYSPNELQLYLIDFKKGVEFKTYATHRLPHAQVIAIESEREFGLSVLAGLDAELTRRGDLFRAAGVDGLAAYRHSLLTSPVRRQTSEDKDSLPRILLLVDEFQEFFVEDDAVTKATGGFLDRLVRQGRAFGIHVLLGSQSLAGAYSLARSTIDQMGVRIALQSSEADSRLILADDNGAARLLSRPGEAIYNDANGRVEGNNPFQVAWLSDDKRGDYLKQVYSLAQQRNYRPPRPQIVFEGNALARIEDNRILSDLLSTLSLTLENDQSRGYAFLGEPIAIADPTAARFRRQSASNLLIVGQNEEAALGMCLTTLISIVAYSPIPAFQSRLYILDFTPIDAPHSDILRSFRDALPTSVRWGRRREMPELIAEIAAEVDRRVADDATSYPPHYLLIFGLQRARDLRADENVGFGSYSFDPLDEPAPPKPEKQFPTILSEGPEVGIHTIVWCDTVANLNRSLDRRSLREFEMRVAFQMSGEDSANLIDTPAAGKLGPNRAIFVSEEEARSEKFRPYHLPSTEWLAWALGQLAGRQQ
ncbi:MAG: FtsK/SpoIIIE domain-containing protein [Caldilineaceae bacterium]